MSGLMYAGVVEETLRASWAITNAVVLREVSDHQPVKIACK